MCDMLYFQNKFDSITKKNGGTVGTVVVGRGGTGTKRDGGKQVKTDKQVIANTLQTNTVPLLMHSSYPKAFC